MKIARVGSVPFFLYNHLRRQIAATVEAGHEVVLISSDGPEVEWIKKIPGIRFHEIDIPRRISPLRDLRALWQLFFLFRREGFDIVHSGTPKAGMLCAVAGFLARVPIRLHTFTGQAWVEMHGAMRLIVKTGDWVTATLNTFCYADSASQVEFIVAEGVVKEDKIRVLGSGSLAGVALDRFNLEKWADSTEETIEELNIPSGYKVVTFIGRLTKDKGINELVAAFKMLRKEGIKCILLLIGPEETKDGSLSNAVAGWSDSDIRAIGYSTEPERYLAMTDIFCLPSYREGFPNVMIEAAAMGVPAVGTDIVGVRDTVIEGETGLLVPPKSVDDLVRALKVLLTDVELCKQMGEKARERACREFSSERVNQAVLDEYVRLRQCLIGPAL